jgi:hypothetical protein
MFLKIPGGKMGKERDIVDAIDRWVYWHPIQFAVVFFVGIFGFAVFMASLPMMVGVRHTNINAKNGSCECMENGRCTCGITCNCGEK